MVVLGPPSEGSPFHTSDRVVGLRTKTGESWRKVFKPTDLATALAGVADNTNATVDVSVERQRNEKVSLITLKRVTLSVRMSSKDKALYHKPPPRSVKTLVSKTERSASPQAARTRGETSTSPRAVKTTNMWVSDTRSVSPRPAAPVRATPLRVNPTAELIPEILKFSDAESVSSSPDRERYLYLPSTIVAPPSVPPLLDDPHDVSSDDTDDLFAFPVAVADQTLQPTEPRRPTLPPAAEVSSDDENFL